MNKLNFNSQVCTTIEQSKRILALGLKPETADMVHYKSASMQIWGVLATPFDEDCRGFEKTYIPAWSLHRLIEMYSERYIACSVNLKELTFDWLINEIEIHIKEGDFNKQYLKE